MYIFICILLNAMINIDLVFLFTGYMDSLDRTAMQSFTLCFIYGSKIGDYLILVCILDMPMIIIATSTNWQSSLQNSNISQKKKSYEPIADQKKSICQTSWFPIRSPVFLERRNYTHCYSMLRKKPSEMHHLWFSLGKQCICAECITKFCSYSALVFDNLLRKCYIAMLWKCCAFKNSTYI